MVLSSVSVGTFADELIFEPEVSATTEAGEDEAYFGDDVVTGDEQNEEDNAADETFFADEVIEDDQVNDDVIAEISKSDLNNVYNYKYTYKICNNDNCYDNLIAFNNNTISIATLFEILNRENYNIEGDKYHYIVYDVDNNKYEFSYDFSELNNDGIELYYLKNDEKVFYGEYGTLYYDTVNKMFNLNIKLQ